MNSAIDHLVVTARSRDEGMAWIAGTIGVVHGPRRRASADGHAQRARPARRGDLSRGDRAEPGRAVAGDGALVLDGAAPSLIEWSTTDHPAARLPDAGCTLERLEIRHPHGARLQGLLQGMGFAGPLALSGSGDGCDLSATIRTPGGIRVLRSS